MKIPIRNMVCDRCIRTVQRIMQEAGVVARDIRLGEVETELPLTEIQEEQIRLALTAEGFEWIDNHKAQLVAQIKQLILALIRQGELDEMKEKLSVYLSRALHRDYHQLSSVFSEAENTTIEQYFILQKIERIKEWLVYNEWTLSEMALKLGYSSTAHLSAQFRKVTGFTPTQFKQLKEHHRKQLDKL